MIFFLGVGVGVGMGVGVGVGVVIFVVYEWFFLESKENLVYLFFG